MLNKEKQSRLKLTKAERQKINAAILMARNRNKKEKTAQDSIPFQKMYPDGICRVTDKLYTKTIRFQDINYQLAQNEDKTAIFESWCDFLNYFDSSIHFQLSFLNMTANANDYESSVTINPQQDDFDSIRSEYSEMLQSQLSKGNNGLMKTKYLTFGIEADSVKIAKPRLERIENDLWNAFKRLGASVDSLDGKERLRLCHNILRMDGNESTQPSSTFASWSSPALPPAS